MIYHLIIPKYKVIPTVKITTEMKPGHKLRFKDVVYKIVEIDGNDITVAHRVRKTTVGTQFANSSV
jgi:hypothetical protein